MDIALVSMVISWLSLIEDAALKKQRFTWETMALPPVQPSRWPEVMWHAALTFITGIMHITKCVLGITRSSHCMKQEVVCAKI